MQLRLWQLVWQRGKRICAHGRPTPILNGPLANSPVGVSAVGGGAVSPPRRSLTPTRRRCGDTAPCYHSQSLNLSLRLWIEPHQEHVGRSSRQQRRRVKSARSVETTCNDWESC